jgi:hypothetical protein
MIAQRKEDDLAKARRLIEAAETKAHNVIKRTFAEAAKVARKWRLTGRLAPAEVVDSVGGSRLLKRF